MLIPRRWRAIKAYRCPWYQVQVYRLEQPYDHFGTPLPYVVEKLEWQHDATYAYCTCKQAKEFFRRWTMNARFLNSELEYIRQRKETTLQEEDNKEPERKPFVPKVITGGGGTYDDPNWLQNLPEQTIFLAKDKYMQDQHGNRITSNQIDLEKYTLVLKYNRAAWLTLHMVDRMVDPVYVDMLQFSLRKQFIEAIAE